MNTSILTYQPPHSLVCMYFTNGLRRSVFSLQTVLCNLSHCFGRDKESNWSSAFGILRFCCIKEWRRVGSRLPIMSSFTWFPSDNIFLEKKVHWLNVNGILTQCILGGKAIRKVWIFGAPGSVVLWLLLNAQNYNTYFFTVYAFSLTQPALEILILYMRVLSIRALS